MSPNQSKGTRWWCVVDIFGLDALVTPVRLDSWLAMCLSIVIPWFKDIQGFLSPIVGVNYLWGIFKLHATRHAMTTRNPIGGTHGPISTGWWTWRLDMVKSLRGCPTRIRWLRAVQWSWKLKAVNPQMLDGGSKGRLFHVGNAWGKGTEIPSFWCISSTTADWCFYLILWLCPKGTAIEWQLH